MKKRMCFIALTLALCLAFSAALSDTSGDFTYAVMEDGSAELVSCRQESGDAVIPEALDGHTIMSVRKNPFYRTSTGDNRCTPIVAIDHPSLDTKDGVLFCKTDRTLVAYPRVIKEETYEIPAGITGIKDYAFVGCKYLTSVTIPDSVTSIGEKAFWGCTSLTSVTIPDSVTSIGEGAFCKCTSLTSVTIPDSVTSIGKYAFYKCGSLTSVTIPASVTSIEDGAFWGCPSLTSIIVAPGSYALSYCIKHNLPYNDGVDYGDDSLDWLTGDP